MKKTSAWRHPKQRWRRKDGQNRLRVRVDLLQEHIDQLKSILGAAQRGAEYIIETVLGHWEPGKADLMEMFSRSDWIHLIRMFENDPFSTFDLRIFMGVLLQRLSDSMHPQTFFSMEGKLKRLTLLEQMILHAIIMSYWHGVGQPEWWQMAKWVKATKTQCREWRANQISNQSSNHPDLSQDADTEDTLS